MGTDLRNAARQALVALEELNGCQSLAPPLASEAAKKAAGIPSGVNPDA